MQIKQIDIAGTPGWQFDDFYDDPIRILNWIASTPPHPTGVNSSNSNGAYYSDMRHQVGPLKYLEPYISLIEETHGGIKNDSSEPAIFTNFMHWRPHEFNDYKNNYWYPHYDTAWTFILYLNPTEPKNGTNIYKAIGDYREKVQMHEWEHHKPWHPKEHYEVVDYFEPVFNRGYLFNSGNLLHGAAVEDDTYFQDMFRLNQVIFFNEKLYD